MLTRLHDATSLPCPDSSQIQPNQAGENARRPRRPAQRHRISRYQDTNRTQYARRTRREGSACFGEIVNSKPKHPILDSPGVNGFMRAG